VCLCDFLKVGGGEGQEPSREGQYQAYFYMELGPKVEPLMYPHSAPCNSRKLAMKGGDCQ
jgi:hypothetical protein